MWILILSFMSIYDKNGVAVTTQEFSSKERCMSAATLYIKQNYHDSPYTPKPKAICVPK